MGGKVNVYILTCWQVVEGSWVMHIRNVFLDKETGEKYRRSLQGTVHGAVFCLEVYKVNEESLKKFRAKLQEEKRKRGLNENDISLLLEYLGYHPSGVAQS